jgi:hypothetical protein
VLDKVASTAKSAVTSITKREQKAPLERGAPRPARLQTAHAPGSSSTTTNTTNTISA